MELGVFAYVIAAVAAYLLGSVSVSVLLTKLVFHNDVRSQGSGNAGATNVARVFGMGAGIITLLKTPVINSYNITDDTKLIAHQLMNAISFIVIFRSANTILAKGVLRGGGDTKFLVYADSSLMWFVAIPLGALAGLVLNLPSFWIYVCLYIDQILKAIWCVFRLRSGKWIKKIRGVKGG